MAGEVSNSKEGEKLDKILSHLDSVHKRLDAMEEGYADSKKRLDAACERMDATDKARADAEEQTKEQERADAARKDAEKEEEEKKAKADAARKDAEDKEKEDKAKADAARADSADLATQIADLRKQIPVELAEEDRARFVDVQSKAERVAQAFGDFAPRWMSGESLPQYRQRLLSKFKQHSADWKGVDLAKLGDDALAVAETKIYADAWGAATRPVNIEGGTLREVTENDRTGRKITRFYGDPEACWGPFKQPARHVTGWNTKFN